jgi:hypothetical protein
MIQENNNSNTNNFFSVWKESVDTYYAGLEKIIPQYIQSMTNLYQEYSKTWNAAIDSLIDVEQNISSRTGIKLEIPQSAIKATNDANHEAQKLIDFQNKIAITAIDSSCRGLETYHNNIESLANLNKQVIVSMVPNFANARNN